MCHTHDSLRICSTGRDWEMEQIIAKLTIIGLKQVSSSFLVCVTVEQIIFLMSTLTIIALLAIIALLKVS